MYKVVTSTDLNITVNLPDNITPLRGIMIFTGLQTDTDDDEAPAYTNSQFLQNFYVFHSDDSQVQEIVGMLRVASLSIEAAATGMVRPI